MPHLSRGIQCSRILLTVLNIVFLLCGFGLLGTGFYIVARGRFNAILALYNITQALGNSIMLWTGIGLIILGTFITCLALFGCVGSVYKKRIFLYIYAIAIIIIILLEFVFVIVMFKYRSQIWESYDTGFKIFFTNAYSFNQTQNITIIKRIEREFQCCGVDSFFDYTMTGIIPPADCYPKQNMTARIFDIGCAPAIAEWVWNNLPYFIGFTALILLTQIFGIISSIILGAITHYIQQADGFVNHTVQN